MILHASKKFGELRRKWNSSRLRWRRRCRWYANYFFLSLNEKRKTKTGSRKKEMAHLSSLSFFLSFGMHRRISIRWFVYKSVTPSVTHFRQAAPRRTHRVPGIRSCSFSTPRVFLSDKGFIRTCVINIKGLSCTISSYKQLNPVTDAAEVAYQKYLATQT